MVEHLAVNETVPGSSPGGGAGATEDRSGRNRRSGISPVGDGLANDCRVRRDRPSCHLPPIPGSRRTTQAYT